MAENEELDVFKNRRWRSFISTVRGAPSLYDEVVLREFDRAFTRSLRRVFKLLRVEDLIKACIVGDAVEVNRLRKEHRQNRDRAEDFADHIVMVCKPGMSYREGVDEFVHGACGQIGRASCRER